MSIKILLITAIFLCSLNLLMSGCNKSPVVSPIETKSQNQSTSTEASNPDTENNQITDSATDETEIETEIVEDFPEIILDTPPEEALETCSISSDFQVINTGQDIAINCENNQVAFSFLRDGENLLVKILLNAPERIFGINLEILYNPNIVEFLDYTEGDFFQGGIFLTNTNTENSCNKSLILGHSLLGQITGRDGVGNIGTLRWIVLDHSSKMWLQIKNMAVSKRFFDEEPIPRSCQQASLALNF